MSRLPNFKKILSKDATKITTKQRGNLFEAANDTTVIAKLFPGIPFDYGDFRDKQLDNLYLDFVIRLEDLADLSCAAYSHKTSNVIRKRALTILAAMERRKQVLLKGKKKVKQIEAYLKKHEALLFSLGYVAELSSLA